MSETPPGPCKAAAVRRGVRRFNLGRYLSAHQVWEAVARDAAVEERAFLEGLIQLATGMHLRTRRGGTRGAVHLLSQAMVSLDDYRPQAYGVDVERVLTEFTSFIDWLKQIDRPHQFMDWFKSPRIG